MIRKIEYVCGFCFNSDLTQVALIQKLRPQFLFGRLNGIGGKINPGEFPKDAMPREFEEETGVLVPYWLYMLTLKGPNFAVHFYHNVVEHSVFEQIRTNTDEEVYKADVCDVLSGALPQVENLPWLVELAVYLRSNPTEYISAPF